MTRTLTLLIFILVASALVASGQPRTPSTPSRPFIVKTRQQVTDVYRALEKQDGNKNTDVVPAAGVQMRVAVFHDEKRDNDLYEVHDSSDDIYYVLEGKATLWLGGVLTEPNDISPGEWRSKTVSGGQKIAIGKGDLIVVPRGTVHQRTVVGKGFSMILIKVFADVVKQ